jgi:hypothetical protein
MNDETISSVFQRNNQKEEIINSEPQKTEELQDNTENSIDNKLRTEDKI